ncbi:MAG: hypothetical protein H7Y89_19800 [Steroidobacteraceae bacterium]|nr:hypothetical protein [Steroidobacteraceae bacterium]
MSTAPDLYSAVKPDLGAIAGPLVERSEKLLLEQGDFLPHAAVLTDEGRVCLLGAMCNSNKGFANSWHILPMIYDGLRSMANERELRAVGVAACVDEIPGVGHTRAIRVFVEHRLAYTIAFYLPFSRDEDGRYEFGKTISMQADPEIKVWTQGF